MVRWVNTAMFFVMLMAIFAIFAVKLHCVLGRENSPSTGQGMMSFGMALSLENSAHFATAFRQLRVF